MEIDDVGMDTVMFLSQIDNVCMGRERRVGFESNGGVDSENWVKKKEEEGRKFGTNGGGGPFDSLRKRRRGFDSATSGDVDAKA
ncbi:hypothetical protein LOK49_LG05G01691 [Camellia lanceoleosa]|uniref:Uncharacterized protein n=1 Tax=Camellia lanceoleosa TaxID=1840588 RepID=A0ACC0HPC9_9ERIC|nr:hypothetical protein LOK49_LG05G01691 [Camellia lanceoleosa]